MTITGVDQKKCDACGLCVQECAAGCFSINGTGRAVYQDPHGWCTGCGHCLAVCPKNAIDCGTEEKPADYVGRMPGFEYTVHLLHSKRSVRRYKNKAVLRTDIEKLLEVMRFSPSGHNAQTCEYIVVTDSGMKRTLLDATIASFHSFRRLMRIHVLLKPFVPRPLYDILSSRSTALGIEDMIRRYKSGEDVIFYNAPAVILVHVPDMGGMSFIDPAIAFTYGMLAAHALELGSCWIGFAMLAVEKNQKIMDALHIPRGRMIAGIMTLGYPVNRFRRVPVRNKVKAAWFA